MIPYISLRSGAMVKSPQPVIKSSILSDTEQNTANRLLFTGPVLTGLPTLPAANSARSVTVVDGDTFTVAAGGMRMPGARPAYNEIASWSGSSADNRLGPFGSRNDYSATATTVTANSLSTYWYKKSLTTYSTNDVIRIRFKAQAVGAGVVMNFRMYRSGVPSNQTIIQENLSDMAVHEMTMSLTLTGSGTVEFGLDPRASIQAGAQAGEYLFTDVMVENVTAKTNQNPSEYISAGVGDGTEVNGDPEFNSSVGGYWSDSGSSWTVSGGVATSTGGSTLFRNGVTVAGRRYVGEVKNNAAVACTVYIGGTQVSIPAAIGITPFNVVATNTQLAAQSGASGVELDYIRVQEATKPFGVNGLYWYDYSNPNTVSSNKVVTGTGSDIASEGWHAEASDERGAAIPISNLSASTGALSFRLKVDTLQSSNQAIVSFNGQTTTAPFYINSSNQLCMKDSVLTITGPTLSNGNTYAVKARWNNSGTFNFSVDGVIQSPASFAGFTTGSSIELMKGSTIGNIKNFRTYESGWDSWLKVFF